MEEAKLIAESIGEKSFQGTNGWLQKWKRMNNIAKMNIAKMNIAGEEGDVSSDTVDIWQERVLKFIQGYAPEEVWNQDETGSCWKALLEKSLLEKGKCCRGGKNSMQ